MTRAAWALPAIVAVAAGLLTAGGSLPAGAAPPQLSLSSPIVRGVQASVGELGLEPRQPYVLTTSAGVWANGYPTITKDADGFGQLSARFTLPDSAPYTASVTVTVELAADGSTVGEASSPVAPPTLGASDQLPLDCPGQPFEPSTAGFAPGDYSLSSDDATFDPTTVSTGGGALDAFSMTPDADGPKTFQVTATGPDSQAYTFTERRGMQRQADETEGSTPWALHWTAHCFVPGKKAWVQKIPNNVSTVEDAVAAADGTIRFTTFLYPAAHPSTITPIVYATHDGQQTQTAQLTLPGTTLRTGAAVDQANPLQSANPGYRLEDNGCDPTVFHYRANGVRTAVWSARRVSRRTAGCELSLSRSGNLALRGAGGKVLWQTHTKGSAGGNKLLMRNSGELSLVTKNGKTIWTDTGGAS